MKYKLTFSGPNPNNPEKYAVLTTADAVVVKVGVSCGTDCMDWTIGMSITPVIEWCDVHCVNVRVVGTGAD